ncbi:MAG: FecR domain-containing protein [Acidobacteria bacterium]|nr:FecR domain-containing protein [Acidobacteriota bacterium]
MRKMFKISSLFIVPLLLPVFFNGTAIAQHMISTRAGMVNRTQGKVLIVRKEATDESENGQASNGTQLRDGDKLGTESRSYAEVLLNPGSYLRLNELSEICTLNTSLTEIRVELIKGSAIIEVGEVDKKSPIEIVTPDGSIFIKKDGLHRVDVKDGKSIIAVRQGEAFLGTREEVLANRAFKVKSGKVTQLGSSSAPILAKINKDLIDDFDTWSFNRAQTLMASNNNILSRRGGIDNLGFGWLYDPFYRSYTYIPRRLSFYSPYGFCFYNQNNYCANCYSPSTGSAGTVSQQPTRRAREIAGNDRGTIRRETGPRITDSPSIDSGSRGGYRGNSGSSRGGAGAGAGSSSSPSGPRSTGPSPSRPQRSETGGGRSRMPGRNIPD